MAEINERDKKFITLKIDMVSWIKILFIFSYLNFLERLFKNLFFWYFFYRK